MRKSRKNIRELSDNSHFQNEKCSFLSRLGRNSALTGLYTNFTFPQNGVHFIAINDDEVNADPNRSSSRKRTSMWASKILTPMH